MTNLYEPLYTEATDLRQHRPGVPPYTRGIYTNMYLGRPWTIRQYAGFSSADDSNRFYRQALQAGQRGLSVAFDLPTHRGYDSDHQRSAGDVGKAGVAIDSIDDMAKLFDGIPLDQISVSMTMNGAVLPIVACFLVVAERQGIDYKNLRGTIQNDILKEYIVRNTYIYPPPPSMRIAVDVIDYLSNNVPKFNGISVSGYHFHEAGADAALELALTLADALSYLDCCQQRQLDIDSIAPRLSFFLAIGMNFLQEIAKLRAARALWYELMQRYRPKNAKSSIFRVHCQTSGYSLTQQQPLNNVVRTTIEAMAAVLGGTQSLHTNAYDEAISLPTDDAARIARNTQLIIQHETDLTKTIDPFGGSYAIEALTTDLQQRAKKIIDEIDQQGGMLTAIANGYPKSLIEESAAHKQALVDSGQQTIVGVNNFQIDQSTMFEHRQIDSDHLRKHQLVSLQKLKQTRDNNAVQRTLEQLRNCAKSNDNLMPVTIDAVRNRATVGEISDTLAQVFGRYQATSIVNSSTTYLDSYGDKTRLRAVQTQVRDFATHHGRQPRMLVAKLGQDGHDRGLQLIAAGFSNFGFDVDLSPLFQTPAEVAKQAIDNDVQVVGISTHTASHRLLIPKLLDTLQTNNAGQIIVVVGGIIPPADHQFLRAKGVQAILDPGTPIPDCVEQVMRLLQ